MAEEPSKKTPPQGRRSESGSDRPERPERGERPDRGERSERQDRPERPEKPASAPSAPSFAHQWAEVKPKAGGYYWGTGRRKTAVARVRIKPGTGKFEINGRPIEHYFHAERDRNVIVAPLAVTDTRSRFDVFVTTSGGGPTGQADAIVLGVARALLEASKEYEPALRNGRYLTRDAREVERKKYGRAGARRSFQFSKR